MPIKYLRKWTIILLIAIPVVFLLQQVSKSLNTVNKLAIKENTFTFLTEYSYFEDLSGQMPLGQITAELPNFIQTEFNKPKTDFGPQAYWYSLKLTNLHPSKEQFVMLMDNPMVDIIDVYELQQGQYQLIKQLGDTRIDNDLDELAFPTLNLKINSNQTLELLIRSKTVGAANLPFSIFNADEFPRYKDAIYLLWGAFIGICLVITVYNLILFIGTNEAVYLFYIGYVASFLLELGVVHGYNVYLVPQVVYTWLNTNIIGVNFVLTFFSLMFAVHFLRFNEEPKRRITRVAVTVGFIYLLSAAVSLFVIEYKAALVFFSLQVVLYFVAMTLMVIKLREGVRWANYYVISWLPLFIGAAVGPLFLTGYLDYDFWTRHALLLGVMFELTFMSMALAQRLRTSEKERIYQSTHEQQFGFANQYFLEQKVNKIIQDKELNDFSLVIVSLSNIDTYLPYLSKQQVTSLVNRVAFELETNLTENLMVVDLDTESEYKKTAMIRDGLFAYMISSNDEFLLKNVLVNLSDKQPLTYKIGELTLNLICYSSAVHYTDEVDLHELVNKAQQQIDLASEKHQLYSIYTETARTESRKKVQMASDLQKAILEERLELYHQPQISLKTGLVCGSEVLVRWWHDEFGYIPPDQFIKVAEDTGVINKLSRWVFKTACGHLISLRENTHVDHKISVNISAYDVMTDGFLSYLVEMLTEYNLKADDFILELTETAAINDTNRFSKNLDELKELGFILSIDDFGTGYSSLTYISKHPFDELKIDRDFVKNIHISDTDLNIIASTIALAKSLNYKVVAEGIEDAESISLLKKMGCDFAQGYYLSKPKPMHEYLDWLDEAEIKEEFSQY